MKRLSSSTERIKPHYTVLVIGSGYGGGIAASRLARAGQRVCVLERGKELQPGEYPNTQVSFLKEVQTDLPLKHIGSPTGLYDIRYNDDINVIVGCGLGGTSLINSGASLRADARVFADRRWPVEIRNEESMERYYGYAEEMLQPVPYPDHFPRLAKLDALEKSARQLHEDFYPIPIHTNFRELPNGVNHVGVPQRPCVLCGDCETGCNYHAKNTILMNYLPDAVDHGAEVFTQIAAHYLERQGEGWWVHCQRLDDRAGARTALALSADIVILGAGTLGSTEILLRSAANGLLLSPALGSRFSGNGDMLGFSYNCDEEINGVGFGDRRPEEMQPSGPCIAGIVDARKGRALADGMVLEVGGIPGAFAAWLPLAFAATAKLLGVDTDYGLRDKLREQGRELESKLKGPYAGAIGNTQTYVVVAHDDSGGTMYLDDDRLRIRWPGVGKQPEFEKASELMRRATEALGGTYLPIPTWNTLTNQQLLTGHPLGGCVMADDAQDGVVNHKGQVYSNASGTTAYRGLYVADAAVIPHSLGVNPLLTISALAERSCHQLARDHGWTISYALA
jgi:cholesterol oxidase